MVTTKHKSMSQIEVDNNAFDMFKRKHYVYFSGCGVRDDFIRQIWEWVREEKN